MSIKTGDPNRDAMVKKFIEVLQAKYPTNTENLTEEQLIELAIFGKELEQQMFQNYREYKTYCDRARSLIFNLKDPKNPDLRETVRAMTMSPQVLAVMDTKELASSIVKKHRTEIQNQNMQARRTDYLLEQMQKSTAGKGFFTCKKCHSKNTTYFQMQTRGADEPMTNFVTCLDCKNKWKC